VLISRFSFVENSLHFYLVDFPVACQITAVTLMVMGNSKNLMLAKYTFYSHRITYKIAMLTFKTKLHRQHVYLFDILQNYTPTRQLRSSSADLLKRQTTSTKTSDRAFSAAAVKIWNDLPVTVRFATSSEQFARRLKTHLFALSFD